MESDAVKLGFELVGGLSTLGGVLFGLYHLVRRVNIGASKEGRAHRAESEIFAEYRDAMKELRADLAASKEETARVRVRLELAIERGSRQQTEILLLKTAEMAARQDRTDIVQRLDVQEEHTKLLPQLMTNIFDEGMPTHTRRYDPDKRK